MEPDLSDLSDLTVATHTIQICITPILSKGQS